jgi:orotate phosphoribosyltransferase
MKKRIAQHLLSIGAVELRPNDPFTWTSGIKSPIYCDNRLTISYPDVREELANGFVELIKTHFPDAEVIAGAATGGVPHAAWVAQKLNLPMIYVRSKPKGYGKGSQVEGKLIEGQKVVVIEDLISTGGSSLNVAHAVQAEGGEVLGVCAIFTYQLPKAEQAFQKASIPLFTLSDYTALIEVAQETGMITDYEVQLLQQWREDPENFFSN